jgi:deazaflavin-dependent oxidoreductase (nitroreductase family)
MLNKIGEPTAPEGLKLKLFRLPLYLYRFNLGFLLGERFIHLKYWGRKSGDLKEAVIEVIDQDKSDRKVYSASGFGEKSQWFKNILANNSVFVTVKNTEYKATAKVLSAIQAEEVLLRYVKAHPKSIKSVARLSGYKMDGSEQDVIEFSKVIKIIELTLDKKA